MSAAISASSARSKVMMTAATLKTWKMGPGACHVRISLVGGG